MCSLYLVGATKDGSGTVLYTGDAMVPWDVNGTSDFYLRRNGVSTLLTSDGTRPTPTIHFEGVSEDASHVFFSSGGPVTTDDTDSSNDVFEYFSGQIRRVSTGAGGGNQRFEVHYQGTSPDGSKVFFDTSEQLDPRDTDSSGDLYVRDGGRTVLLTTAPRNDVTAGGYLMGATADSRAEFFQTNESLAADDGDRCLDVYRRVDGVVSSAIPDTGTVQICHDENFLASTDDGSVIFFRDEANNIHRATCEGATAAVYSRATPPLSSARLADFSTDGSKAFLETTERLVASDTDDRQDVYKWEGGRYELLSTGPVGGNGDFVSLLSGASNDGSRALIATDERLTADDQPGPTYPNNYDVFLRTGSTTTLVTKIGDQRDLEHQGPARASENADRLIFKGGDSNGSIWEWANGQLSQVSAMGAELVHWQLIADDVAHVFVGNQDIVDWRLSPLPARPAPARISACLAAAGRGASAIGRSLGPRLTRLRVSPRQFRRGRRLPRLSKAARRGATISFRLSQRARVRLVFSRGKRCRRGRSLRCSRWRRAGSFSIQAPSGRTRMRFHGRISRKRTLRPGRYRLIARAVDSSGRIASQRSTRFRLLKKK